MYVELIFSTLQLQAIHTEKDFSEDLFSHIPSYHFRNFNHICEQTRFVWRLLSVNYGYDRKFCKLRFPAISSLLQMSFFTLFLHLPSSQNPKTCLLSSPESVTWFYLALWAFGCLLFSGIWYRPPGLPPTQPTKYILHRICNRFFWIHRLLIQSVDYFTFDLSLKCRCIWKKWASRSHFFEPIWLQHALTSPFDSYTLPLADFLNLCLDYPTSMPLCPW